MRCRLALMLSGVIGWIEIPQRSSLRPYQGVLSFLSGSTGGTGSETPRVHHAARRRGMAARGARAAGRARLAYWRDTLAADCRSVFYYFYKLKFQKNPAFAWRFSPSNLACASEHGVTSTAALNLGVAKRPSS